MKTGRTVSRFWQVAFWVTVFHFVICGLIVGYGTLNDWREWIKTFERRELGLLNAIALWLVLNSGWIACLLVIADVPAAFLMFKLAIRSPNRKGNILYMSSVFLVWAIHAGAIAYLSNIRTLHTSHMTYDFEGIAPLGFADLVALLPALVMLIGSLLVGWHGPPAGFCAACGYNLTGNVSGVCPECSTPVPKEPADESPRPA